MIGTESWHVIPGFGKYEITRTGLVRHQRFKRILKHHQASNGYHQVAVYSDFLQKSITKCVHQLLAIAFLGKKPTAMEVSFIDRDKTNVQASNLTYKLSKHNHCRKIIPDNYCPYCGKLCPPRRKYCSALHKYLHPRVLLKCAYCGDSFYRLKCVVKRSTPSRGYSNGRVFCSIKHYQLFRAEQRQTELYR